MKFYKNLSDEIESVVLVLASFHLQGLLIEHFKKNNWLNVKEYEEMARKVNNKYFKK